MSAALQLVPESVTVLHVCSIDETQQGEAEPAWTWREMPSLLYSIAKIAVSVHTGRMFPDAGDQYRKLDKFRVLLMYATEYPSRRKRNPMNVQDMVQRWVPIIRGLSVGHDKAEIDRCEFELEEHIMPMLSAPVKQLREFYSALVDALKADPTIPMFVWAMFESWGEAILKKAPDGEVIELKKSISVRIAEMVEKDVHADLKDALVGALQWRSEPQLQVIETKLKEGHKPRLRGRESCLFLDVDGAQVML